jgi:hypothetical protein
MGRSRGNVEQTLGGKEEENHMHVVNHAVILFRRYTKFLALVGTD